MPRMTLGQAARAGFAARASIYRDAQAGKLSIVVEGDRKLVELTELIRVYGEPGARPLPAAAILAAPELAQRVELERRIAELETSKAAIADELRQERDSARAAAGAAALERAKLIELLDRAQRQAADSTKLLADLRAPWWRRLVGGGA